MTKVKIMTGGETGMREQRYEERGENVKIGEEAFRRW